MGRPPRAQSTSMASETTMEPMAGINETGALAANSSGGESAALLENQALKGLIIKLTNDMKEMQLALHDVVGANGLAEKKWKMNEIGHGKGIVHTDYNGNILVDSKMVPGSGVFTDENGKVQDTQVIVYTLLDGSQAKMSYREFGQMIGSRTKPCLLKDYIVFEGRPDTNRPGFYPCEDTQRQIRATGDIEVYVGERDPQDENKINYDMGQTIKIKRHLIN